MTMTPEREAQLKAEWDELLRPFLPKKKPLPKPKIVVSEGQTVRDADVAVSPADRNARAAVDGMVRVRRADFVTVNMAAYEAQQADKDRERAVRRARDPYRLGLYGNVDED
jgi:hypothetical protein